MGQTVVQIYFEQIFIESFIFLWYKYFMELQYLEQIFIEITILEQTFNEICQYVSLGTNLIFK